jgi:Phosphatidylinositol 3- and 4-kinase
MGHEPPSDARPEIDRAAALELLGHGKIDVQGRLVDASNATLYCELALDGVARVCVYKPIAGERPLWDFPDGTLGLREVAAFAVSDASGWDLVPPTVLRDGPFGPGMCQLWIDVDETIDLGQLVRSDHDDLRRMCVLDAIINNADRKGGHLLPTTDGRIFGVDHGVCFSTEDKLRTVLWQWRGRPIPADLVETLTSLRAELDAGLGRALGDLLDLAELRATRRRTDRLIRSGRFPQPSGDWPAVPWPPF